MRRIDRTKPPPGWEQGPDGLCGRIERPEPGWVAVDLERTLEIYLQDCGPAIDDALARLVEWLDKMADESENEDEGDGLRIAADAIESGEWRK